MDGVCGVFCGEYALDQFSMLVANGVDKALYKGRELSLAEDANAFNTIELWAYNPETLAKNGICDKISLILSLESNEDERVQKELEKIKEEVKW